MGRCVGLTGRSACASVALLGVTRISRIAVRVARH